MEIQPVQNIQQPKNTICMKVRNVLTKYKLKLKTLAYDIFERHGYYKDKDGKWKRERDLPSCITRPSEYEGITITETKFYPEDVEKMKNMTPREQIEYKKILMHEGRCYQV